VVHAAEATRVVGGLVELARANRIDDLRERLAELLSRGRIWRLADALDELGESLPLELRLLRAELATRDQTAMLPDLLDLERAVRETAAEDLVTWMNAILAEWGLWRGDFATFGYAFAAPLPETGDRLTLIASARIKRVQALVALATDASAPSTVQLATEVGELFEAAEAPEELAMTKVLFGLGQLAVSDDLDPQLVALVQRGVDELEALDADRLPAGLALVAWSTYLAGDFLTCADSLDRYTEAETSPMPPLVIEGVNAVHLLSRMHLEGATPEIVSELREIFERLRRSTVPGWMLGPIADDLLDHGQVDLAEDLLRAAGSVPSPVRAAGQALRGVQARLRILRLADLSAVQDLFDLYEEWVTSGRDRRAAVSAARCAWSCRAVGLTDEADALESRARELLEPYPELTPWEISYLAGPREGTAPAARGSLRVLQPDVEVVRDGRTVTVGDVQARLLAVLAAARRPVTTDWAITALWPDVDAEAGRNRLAAVLHRLRQRLDLMPDELIRRTRHGLELDPTGWEIDLWEFWERSQGDPKDRLAALKLYRSDLAARQLAYDDVLEDLRDALRRRWVETLRSLVAEGVLSEAEARGLAHRVGHEEVELRG
jgi:hypothetical protein